MINILLFTLSLGDTYTEGHSGETDYFKDYWIPLIGTFVGSAVTILAVYVTMWLNQNSENKKKREERNEEIKKEKNLIKNKLLYFQLLTRNIKDIWKYQIQNFNKFNISANTDKSVLPALKRETLYDLQRLTSKIEQENYYLTYIQKFGNTEKSIKNFNSIFTLSEFYLETMLQVIEGLNTFALLDTEKRRNLSHLLMKDIIDECSKIHIVLARERVPQLAVKITEILDDFYVNSRTNPSFEFYMSDLVDKLHPELDNFRYIPEVMEICLNCRKAKIDYQSLLDGVEEKKNHIEYYNRKMKKHYFAYMIFSKELLKLEISH